MKISITETGAVSSATVTNTRAIQEAIDKCAAAGGGTVYCPAGLFMTGTLWLKNNITLYLENGCTLMACTERGEYNETDCFPEHDIVAHQAADGTHLIIAYKCENVTIAGSGKIHGNHAAFFKEGLRERPDGVSEYHDVYKLPSSRPGQLLYFCLCRNLRVEDISITDASFWSVYMLGCDSIKVKGLTIKTDWKIPNADGLHFNCCRNLTVENCDIDTADDCIVLRGHYKVLGNTDVPSENVIVSNCILSTKCCAFRLGVGDGTIRNCIFSGIVIHNTRTGISIWPAYSERFPRGTDIDNLRFENIVMDAVLPISFVLGSGSTAAVGNITFQNLSCKAAKAICIVGEKNNHLSGIDIIDCAFRFHGDRKQSLFDADTCEEYTAWKYVAEPPACGVFVRYADKLRLRNILLDWTKAEGKRSEAICCIDCENLDGKDIDSGDFSRMGIKSSFRTVRSSEK